MSEPAQFNRAGALELAEALERVHDLEITNAGLLTENAILREEIRELRRDLDVADVIVESVRRVPLHHG